jgi:hypothetical protein
MDPENAYRYTSESEEVCDLRPSTEYTFSVSAVTVAGSGPAISVSFITPQEGEASIHITASTLMIWCGGMLINLALYIHAQLSQTLLVGLKLANITQHQLGFPGKKGIKLSVTLAIQYG